MKVPVSWLREYVEFDLPVEELARRLVFTSCEVDRVVRRGVPDEDGNLEPSPRREGARGREAPERGPAPADEGRRGRGRAAVDRVRRVELRRGGDRRRRASGCGAPDRPHARARKVRGEVSDGMILAEDEVDLGTDHSGIMLLAAGHEPGTPLSDVLPLVDTILEIETGYNRPDLTSVYGIAREVSAVLDVPLAPMPGVQTRASRTTSRWTSASTTSSAARATSGGCSASVQVGDSPPWLKARLIGAGMRPISNVVDVTNYVMLALGNPLHAFDHAKLAEGRIVVRRARAGETIRTLDGQQRTLTSEELVIADAERPVAVAGIMGGEESEVSAETQTVLLEAANFEQLGVLRRRAPAHALRVADALGEGRRPELAEPAANHATELLVELAGARWTGHTDVEASSPNGP